MVRAAIADRIDKHRVLVKGSQVSSTRQHPPELFGLLEAVRA